MRVVWIGWLYWSYAIGFGTGLIIGVGVGVGVMSV